MIGRQFRFTRTTKCRQGDKKNCWLNFTFKYLLLPDNDEMRAEAALVQPSEHILDKLVHSTRRLPSFFLLG